MDHKAFLASLSAADRTALNETKDGPGLRQMAAHFGLILLFAFLIALGIPGWPILLVPQGILLAFLFNLEHECTHKTPFRTAWINEWAGWISGFLILQPFLWFRYFHLAHHRFTNDPERDPELVGKAKPQTWPEYLLFISSIVYWKNKVVLLFQNAFGAITGDYIPKGAYARLRREARITVACYAILIVFSVFVSPILFWVWLLPLVIGFPFLRLYHLAEHGRCPHVQDMFENTRTVFTNRIVRFVTWNMPYHIEHHTVPTVPFHRLPELHQQIRDYLKQTSNGYAAFTVDYASHLKPSRQSHDAPGQTP